MGENKLAKIISEKIKKNARLEEGKTEERDMLLDDVELVIDGKKKKCRIWANVEYTPIYDAGTDDFGEVSFLEDVEYTILDIGIDDTEDGTIYTQEQEKKILAENDDIVNKEIYHEVWSWV